MPMVRRLATRAPARRSQVEAACKKIARYIHQHGLGVGDVLPPQVHLRRELGFSNNSLDPAMRLLVDMGLLTRRTCRGTEIVSLEPLQRLTWTIGLAVMDLPIQGPGAFTAWLVHALQSLLSKRHCACHTYFRVEEPKWPHHRLEDFPGFAADVEDRAIDGMIILPTLDAQGQSAFAAAGIPLLHCGFQEEMPFAALLDFRGMIAAAAAALVAGGARRLALFDSSIRLDADAFDRLVRKTAGVSGRNGLSTEKPCLVPPGVEGGGQVARALLQLPPARRPDALIVTDDFAATGVAQVLASQADYRPGLAVSANKQLPQLWPMPVMRFEFDIDELAARAVQMLQDTLLNPETPPRQERVKARLVVGSEQ